MTFAVFDKVIGLCPVGSLGVKRPKYAKNPKEKNKFPKKKTSESFLAELLCPNKKGPNISEVKVVFSIRRRYVWL